MQIKRGARFPIEEFLQFLDSGGNWAKRSHLTAVRVKEEVNLPGMVVQPLQEYKRAQRQLRNQLRAYVDEWLDSGLHSDGREEPLHRRLNQPRKGWREAAVYLMDCPPVAHLEESGDIDFYFQLHDYNRVSDRGPNRFGDREPKIQAGHDAVQLFLRVLQSEWKYKLAKCRRCRKYFAGTRTLHKMYKRGIHCKACASKVSAIESKKNSDEQWRVRWMRVAATIWPQWREKHGDRAVFVAKKVNKVLGPRERHITRWSITHYRSRVEQMSKSLSEKKGSESLDPRRSWGPDFDRKTPQLARQVQAPTYRKKQRPE